MKMRGEAVAYGAVTIVNAIATGKGAAFGVDLWTKATVDLTEDGAIKTTILNEEKEQTLLAEKCVRAVLDHFGAGALGATVVTQSNIPIAKGLKSSSVAGNAIVLATLAALQRRLEPDEILDLAVAASLEANVTITGAFDDAAASLYGNVVVTDNVSRKVLKTYPVEDYLVLILAPPGKSYTAEVDLGKIKIIAKQAEVAHKEALAGNYWNAMTLNGLIYSHVLKLPADILIEGLEAGALAAGISGKGPAYAFVVQDQSKNALLDVLRRQKGELIISRTRRRASFPEHFAEK